MVRDNNLADINIHPVLHQNHIWPWCDVAETCNLSEKRLWQRYSSALCQLYVGVLQLPLQSLQTHLSRQATILLSDPKCTFLF